MSSDTMPRLRSFLSAIKPTRLGVLFAVLIGFGVGFWQWGKPPKPRVVLENLGNQFRPFFSPDGRTCLILSRDPDNREFLVANWDLQTGQKQHELFKFQGGWRSIAFSPGGKTVAFRFDSMPRIGVWDLGSGRQTASYECDEVGDQINFSPEGRLLAVGQAEVFALWDVAEQKIVKRLVLDGEDFVADGDNAILVGAKGNIVKVWDLANGTLCAAGRDIPKEPSFVTLSSDRRFLTYQNDQNGRLMGGGFIYDLVTGKKQELPGDGSNLGCAIATDRLTVALVYPNGALQSTSWWSRFSEWLGLKHEDSSGPFVTLKAVGSGEQIIVLKNCLNPLFSPDGRTLAVTSADGTSLQLWDLPIRKPIGKILAYAVLAALVTLLVLNGLGWLRRSRRTHGNSSNPSIETEVRTKA